MFFKIFTPNDEPIKLEQGELILVEVKRNIRAKKIKLAIKNNSKAVLTLPKLASYKNGEEFVRKHETWIRSKLTKTQKNLPDKITILDKEYLLKFNQPNKKIPISFEGEQILVSSMIKLEHFDKLLGLRLKKIAKDKIQELVDHYVQKLGVTYSKINIGDAKTRWGSCSSKGVLSFSWRLVIAPLKVLEYVVVHEVCHLVEMNHSEKFWRLVFKLAPDYFDAKLWLKRNGKQLHF